MPRFGTFEKIGKTVRKEKRDKSFNNGNYDLLSVNFVLISGKQLHHQDWSSILFSAHASKHQKKKSQYEKRKSQKSYKSRRKK